MDRLTVVAEDLRPGDEILIPAATVQRIHLHDSHIGIVTEAGYPAMYRRGALVGILRP